MFKLLNDIPINEISWIVFDAMGVVYTYGDDVGFCFIPFLKKKGITQFSQVEIDGIYDKACAGQIPAVEFWKFFGLDKYYPVIQQEYLETMYTLDPNFREIADYCKKHFKIGLLSNDLKEWSIGLREHFKINSYFDLAVVSGDVKICKPTPEIFQLFLKKAGVQGKKCLYIDDRLYNLKQAANLGFYTVQFKRDEPINFQEATFTPNAIIYSFKELLAYLVKNKA